MYANNIHVPMEDSCNICGFMNPNFKDYQELYSNYCPRVVGSISEGSGGLYFNRLYPVRRQNEVGGSPNHSRFSSYNIIENVGPEWLQDELQRLFPEASNPAPSVLLSDPGHSSSSPIDSVKLLDLKRLLYNQPQNVSGCSGQQDPISQQNPHVLATFMSLRLQRASLMVMNNNCTLPQYTHLLPIQNTPTFVQPYTNSEIPGEAASSNGEEYSSNKSAPNTLYTTLDSREMSSSMTTSEVTSISPPINTSSIDNVKNESKKGKPFSKKRQKQKPSSPDTNASGATSSKGSTHGARSKAHSKETVTTSRPSVSKDLASFAVPSTATGGGQRCSFCAKNGETEAMVTSHRLYNPETNVVQCPILRAYRCEACNATGDYAHTRTYCPRIRMLEGNVRSATIALKSTQRQANGMERNAKATIKLPPKFSL